MRLKQANSVTVKQPLKGFKKDSNGQPVVKDWQGWIRKTYSFRVSKLE